VRAAVLTGDRGDGGALIKFIDGGDSLGCSERPKGIDRRRGSSRARWSEAKRSSMEENRREGGRGLAASQAASGERLGTWRGAKDWGPGKRCEM
jgi:hypothetical protein